MSKMVKAILIDPFACTIAQVEHDASDYKNVYAALSHETMKVDTMEAAYPAFLADNDCMMVDEEGLFKECLRWLSIEGYPQKIAGKGLILGVDAEGETADCKTDVEAVRKAVKFLAATPGGFIPVTHVWKPEHH